MNIDDGLRALISRGFWFRDLRDENEDVVVLVGSYGWPTCYDRLLIYGEHDAIAARVVPGARRGVDDVVWSYEGGAVPAIRALLELPAPDEPGAPKVAKRAPSGLWLPTSGV